MKIAIAGTNGLAQLLAHEIETTTTHQFIFLSRRPMEGLSRKGWQVVVVDYSDNSKLRFKLAGIDVVLSTVSGDAQIALIEAAAASSVQRFVPSEFAGPPSIRPSNDLLDNGRRRALLRLAALESGGMKFCAFSCGVLYERFGPGGLSQVQIARGSGMEMEGSYLVDIRRHTARIPARGVDGQPIRISMISLRDLAKAVVTALGLKTWPHEFRVRGDRLTVDELVEAAATMRGRRFQVEELSRESLASGAASARVARERNKELQLQNLSATAEGRFDFPEQLKVRSPTDLNSRIDLQAEPFRSWLQRIWAEER